MNNERYNQIIDEAYKNYRLERNFQINQGVDILSQEEFINKCKTDIEFSEKWGLKIEEKWLSLEERNQWYHINRNANNPTMKSDWKFYELDQQNVPTKLITVTYQENKIEVYE